MVWKYAARACALLSAPLCLLGAVTLASASVDDSTAVSHIVGPEVVLGEFESRTKPIVVNVNVTKGTKTPIVGWVVYNPSTCKAIGEGTWTVNTKPKDGNFSTGILKEKATSGPCIGKTFPYNYIFYTWTAKTGTKDTGAATWESSQCTPKACVDPYKFIFHLVH